MSSIPNASIYAEIRLDGKKAEAEDANKKFLESPTVIALGKLLGLDPARMSLVAILLNFAILLAILYFGLRGALPTMFRNRTAAIQKAMEEARRASADANVRLAEVESRLANLGKEIEQIGAQAEQTAIAEEQRVKLAAQEDVKKVVEAAEQDIAAAGRSARRELTAHAADLAVTLAKQRIQVDNPTDEALIRKFAENLQSAQLIAPSNASGKDGQ